MFQQRLRASSKAPSTRIDGAKAKALISDGAVLLDVRTPGEFSADGLPGAINLPVQHLSHRLAELDPGMAHVVYCRSGARSAVATNVLRRAGFDGAFDLGGRGNWNR